MKPSETVDVEAVVGAAPLGGLAVLVVVLSFIVIMLDGYDFLCLSFVAPSLAKALQIDVASFGPVFSAGFAGVLTGGLAISPISDQVGRKSVLLASVVSFGVCSLLPVFDLSYDRLLLYRFVTGVGLGGAISAAAALTSEYAPRRYRGLLVSFMFAGVAGGGVVGGFLASWLIPLHGWQAAFWMGGLAPLIMVPVLAFWMPESITHLAATGRRGEYVARILRRVDSRADYPPGQVFSVSQPAALQAGGILELFRDGRRAGTLLLWAVLFCSMFTFGLTVSWLPVLITGAGLPLKAGILGPVLMNLGGVAGTLALGFFFGRLGHAVIIAGGLVLATLGVLATGQTIQGVGPVFASVFCAGLFLLGSINATNALAAAFYPTKIRATGVGWALGAGRVGGTIGPALGGALLSLKFGAPAIFSIAAAMLALGTVAIIGLGILYPAQRRLQGRETLLSQEPILPQAPGAPSSPAAAANPADSNMTPGDAMRVVAKPWSA